VTSLPRVLRSFWTWLVVAVLFFATVVIAHPAQSTDASRIAHLETVVKCPSCEDLSVAPSNSESSVAIRAEIARLVHQGDSDNQVLATLEAQYGSTILLAPGISGLTILLITVPIAVLLGGVVIYARLARRKT